MYYKRFVLREPLLFVSALIVGFLPRAWDVFGLAIAQVYRLGFEEYQALKIDAVAQGRLRSILAIYTQLVRRGSHIVPMEFRQLPRSSMFQAAAK